MTILPKLKSTVDRLEKATVISKISKPKPWAHSMVIVEKKDGCLRLCIDPKELSKSVLRQYKTTPCMRLDPEKTKVISAYPLPVCIADLQLLLGMVN